MSITVKETYRSKFSVQLDVSGSADEVKAWLENYMNLWHPAGYGTFARKTEEQLNGDVTYHVTRSTSCD